MQQPMRIGIDLGGTKIAGLALVGESEVVGETRVATPRGDYDGVIRSIVGIVDNLEQEAGLTGSVGIGIPGSLSPQTGLVQNANSTWMNGRNFGADVEMALGRPVRLSNDANCFALSEATDGAAAGAASVFGVILGTGCGGGLVIGGSLVQGHQSIAGEWGHNPLPWPGDDEFPAPECWCGRRGCLELWLSGTGLERDHAQATGQTMPAQEIEMVATFGDAEAALSLERHAGRLARGLAHVVNLFDPAVIVLGGGLSNMAHLYRDVPGLMKDYVFSDHPQIDLRPPEHGDASGVRGAARLWPAAVG